MYENFNKVHTGDPEIDARINYAEAKAALVEKNMAKPKINLKQEKPVAVGVGGGSVTEPTKPKEVKLSEDAQSYATYLKNKGSKINPAEVINE